MFQVLSTLHGGTTGVSETQNHLTFREVPSGGESLNHTYQFIATAMSKSWAGLEIFGFIIHISNLNTTKCLISKSPQAVVKNLMKLRVMLSVPCRLSRILLCYSNSRNMWKSGWHNFKFRFNIYIKNVCIKWFYINA